MGGIIAFLIGVALIAGAFVGRSKLGKAIETAKVELGAEREKLDSARDGYVQRDLQHRINTLRQGVSRVTWIRRALWLGVLGGLAIVAATVISIVPTRNIAVTTAFGKTTDTLDNGFHLTFPWESVTVYDATVQPMIMSGTDPESPTLWVRIANGAMAQMEVSVDWQVDPRADIQQLHLDWRSFDNLAARVIRPRLHDSLNKVFETHDPLISFREAGGQPTAMSALEVKVKEELQAHVPAGIIIRRLAIPLPIYPPAVQEALNKMQQELANTQIALQQKLTAEAQKAAIEILASAKMTPEAFLQYCLVVTERLAQQHIKISEAWTCTSGGLPITVAAK
jgi:regulator of protease activity HflC (stomatin/prohibitin superfamily)